MTPQIARVIADCYRDQACKIPLPRGLDRMLAMNDHEMVYRAVADKLETIRNAGEVQPCR